MTTSTTSPSLTREQLQARHIPFASLRPNTEAFIDYAIPGCAPKYNYAIIGAGVAQGDKQLVALAEKHGFQVGGARMPPGITNPAHMHFTAEVFLCMQGRWALHWGFKPERHSLEFGPGDICSVPTWIYRGFQNVGDHDGFLFTALGQDDTGGILWAPQTLQAARAQGVHLTDDYRIIDERAGQRWDDATMRHLQPMTAQEIDALQDWSPAQMATRIVRHADLQWSRDALLDAALPGCGAEMAPVLGHGMSQDRRHAPPIANAHGHSIEWLRIPAGGRVSLHRVPAKQWLGMYRGTVDIEVEGMSFPLTGSDAAWDSYAVPADAWRTVRNTGPQEAVLLVLSSGDGSKPIEWAPDVVRAAAEAGFAVDADGCVALKRFTDRAQK